METKLLIEKSTAPRSMLFVSGEKPERFPKAMKAGADLVCVDLEDAVHPKRKDEARTAVLQRLLEWQAQRTDADGPGVALRINGLRTLDGLRDLAALAASGLHIDGLLLPKVESEADPQCVDAWLGSQVKYTVALIETPLGIERAASIARAGGRLGALMLGGADLATELGAHFGWEALFSARGRLTSTSKPQKNSPAKPAARWHWASTAKPPSTPNNSS
jgi:citrate lyase beta subunit